MKGISSRIFALIVIGALIAAGCLTIFYQPLQIMKNEVGVAVFDSNNFVDDPWLNRGTRAGPDWPMHRGDLPHSGFSTGSAPDDNSILWTNTTGNGDGYGSPSIADGKVFVGSADGYLYCFDLNTGVRLWRTFLSSADFGVMSTPAVANDHVVVFCSGTDAVYRLRVSDGGLNWTYDPGGGAYGGSSPAIYNGRVYFGSGNAYFYCVDEISGSLIWSYQGGAGPVRPYGIQSSPAAANGRIFVGSCDTYLYCFNEAQPTAPVGQYLWRTSLSDAVFGSPAVVNGRVYCGSGYYDYSEGTNSHTLYCLDELTGAVIWTYTTGSDILSSPAIAYGNCYFTSTDGFLYCVDAMSGGPTPTLYWSKTVTDTWASPSVADGKVVVGARGNNTIGCFDALTGDRIWYYNAGNEIYSSPAIADGKVVVYIRGFPETLICFGTSVVYTVDYIEIRSQPFGGGIPITDQTIEVDTVITGHAAAYNNSVGYLYDIQVDWSVINGGGANASTFPLTSVTSSNFNSGYNGGTATWTANDGSGHTDSVSFTIDPPEIDYIEIVDTQNTGTFPITDQTVAVGFSIQGYAAAFNNSIGYLGDISVNWSVTNLSGAAAYTVPLLGTNSIFYANLSGGIGVWSADDGAGHLDSISFTILTPTVDYITIVDTPGTGSIEISSQAVDVGYTIQGYAAGFNNTAGYINDLVVNWSVSNLGGASAYTTPAQAVDSTFNANLSGGIVFWTADDGKGHTDTVQITINDPSVDLIRIVDTAGTGLAEIAGLSVDVGFTIQGYAAGFNSTAGYIGDIPVNWSVNNTNGASGFTNPITGTGSLLNVGLSGGNVEWIADDGSGHTDSVIYTVKTPEIDYIIIRSGPNGTGSWVGASTYTFGQTDTFFAAGYNNTAGWVTDVPAAWSSDSPEVGNVSFGLFNSTVFTAVNNGTCNITATYDSHTNITGVITIIYFTVDHIVIRDIPANGGSWVGDRFYVVGSQAIFYAAAYNDSAPGDGYIGDISVSWECSNTSIASVTSPGTSTEFSAQYIGGWCNVTARYGPSIFNTTGILTVMAATLDYIIITDWPGGSEVVDPNIGVGGSIWLYASGYNSTGSLYVGLVEVDWSQAPNIIGSFSSSPSNAMLFTAGLAEDFTTISALNSSLNMSDEFTLTIAPPTVDFIQIRDSAGGLGSVVNTGTYAVLETDYFYAAAYNRTSGYIQDVEVVWSSSAQSVGRVTSPGLWTNFTAQTVLAESSCTITTTYSAQVSNSTGLLTVTPLQVDYIQIRNAPGGAGDVVDSVAYLESETDTFYAAAYNNSFGYLGDVGVEWSSSNDSVGHVSSPGSSTTFTAQDVAAEGTCAVTAIYKALVSNTTGILTVSPVTVDYIMIRDSPNGTGGVVGYMIYISTQTDTFYAAAYSNLIGYLYDLDVTWESSDTSAGEVTTPGNSTTFTAQVVDANSTCFITARYSDLVSNTTGPLTVLIRTVDYIQIRDAANNVVNPIELEVGEWTDLYAIGFNFTTGYIGYVTVSWSITDNIVTLDPDHDYTTNLTAIAAGTSTLTATYTLDVSNSTQVTVTTQISAPTGIAVAQVPQGGSLNISWNANPEQNLAGYNLYRSLLPNAEFIKVNDELISTENYMADGLTNGIRYYYYVVAVDTANVSSNPSDIASGIPDRDTDGDGIFDFIDEDDDNDGLPDTSEALVNTNPLIADSDGDGVIDGEDYFPTDPAKWDKADESEDASSLWILIPIIVLIVLLLLFFLLAKRQKPQEPELSTEPQEELPPPPGQLAEEGLPPPPEDFKPPAPDGEALPPPPPEDMDPPPSEDEPPPPPEDEESPPPREEGELPPPPEDSELAPPPGDEELPPPPPWHNKPTSRSTKDE